MEPGCPESVSFVVGDCLICVLNEEWEHRLYSERDLDMLEARLSRPSRSVPRLSGPPVLESFKRAPCP